MSRMAWLARSCLAEQLVLAQFARCVNSIPERQTTARLGRSRRLSLGRAPESPPGVWHQYRRPFFSAALSLGRAGEWRLRIVAAPGTGCHLVSPFPCAQTFLHIKGLR